MSFLITVNNIASIAPTPSNMLVHPTWPIPKILVIPKFLKALLMFTIVATDNQPLNKENGILYLLAILNLSLMW